jgi:N-acyl-D-aspartate/D-glutamate deacylase
MTYPCWPNAVPEVRLTKRDLSDSIVNVTFDTVIANGRWFDGTGGPSGVRHLGLRDGRVAVVSLTPLDTAGSNEVIDAAGRWVIPGMVDIHTHYDIEVLDGPGLSESVRHGVTTILIGSCSLSTVYVTPSDAADLFSRVEAMPREHVVATLDAGKTWTCPAEYIEVLEALPLGPNLAAFIGHSDLRAAYMGLDQSTRKEVTPTETDLQRMEQLLTDALDAGFVGMSTSQLQFDKLDGEVCRSRTLPSTFARRRERHRLNRILRSRGRVLQAAADVVNPTSVLSFLFGSAGPGGALKTSVLSAADPKINKGVVHIVGPSARLVNRLGGDFRWQHLPVPFEVYADGIDLVVFEELHAGGAAIHLKDEIARNELLRQEDYRRQFRKEYQSKISRRVWQRDFFDAEIVACPDHAVVGQSFGQVGVARGVHPVDAFLDLVVEHGSAVRWRTTILNHRPKYLRKLAADPGVQIGFSDAGAHLRNMAFYNSGLRLLRHVYQQEQAGRPFLSLEQAVHRLTGELGEWFGIDAGTLREGDRADLVIIDPQRLDSTLDDYAEAPIEQFGGMSRMVNRNDAAVPAVFIGGRKVIEDGRPSATLGTERTGKFLRAGVSANAPTGVRG